jgi:hypothetical protein
VLLTIYTYILVMIKGKGTRGGGLVARVCGSDKSIMQNFGRKTEGNRATGGGGGGY